MLSDLGIDSGPLLGAIEDGPIVLVERVGDVPPEGWAYWREEKILLRRVDRGPVIVGVRPFLFTWGVMRHVDAYGYKERWCFETVAEAIAAASILGVRGEPKGAIRKVGW